MSDFTIASESTNPTPVDSWDAFNQTQSNIATQGALRKETEARTNAQLLANQQVQRSIDFQQAQERAYAKGFHPTPEFQQQLDKTNTNTNNASPQAQIAAQNPQYSLADLSKGPTPVIPPQQITQTPNGPAVSAYTIPTQTPIQPLTQSPQAQIAAQNPQYSLADLSKGPTPTVTTFPSTIPTSIIPPTTPQTTGTQNQVPQQITQTPTGPSVTATTHPAYELNQLLGPTADLMSAVGNKADVSSMANPTNPQAAPVQITSYGTMDRGVVLKSLADDGFPAEAAQMALKFQLDDAAQAKTNLDNNLKQQATIVAQFAALSHLPDDVKPQAYQQMRQQDIASGIDPSMIPEQYDPTWVAAQQAQATTELDKMKDQQETVKNNIAALQQKSTAMLQKAQAANQYATAAKTKAETSLLSANSGPAGIDITKPLNPALEGVAQSMADGGKGPSMRDPNYNLITSRARQIYADNHGGDPTGFGTVAGVVSANRKSFEGSGNNAQIVAAANNFAEHMQEVQDLISSNPQKAAPALNKLSNWIKTQTGAPAPTEKSALLKAIGSETIKMLKNSNIINVEDEQRMEKDLNNAQSNDQILGVLNTYKGIVQPRIDTTSENYKRAYPGHDLTTDKRLSPTASKLFGYTNTSTTSSQPQSQPQTKVNPANNKTYYLHSDGNYYLQPPQGTK